MPDVLEDSRDAENIVFAEGDAIHLPCVTVSCKTDRLWIARASSRVVRDNFGWSVPAGEGVLLSDSGQCRFEQKQFFALDAC